MIMITPAAIPTLVPTPCASAISLADTVKMVNTFYLSIITIDNYYIDDFWFS